MCKVQYGSRECLIPAAEKKCFLIIIIKKYKKKPSVAIKSVIGSDSDYKVFSKGFFLGFLCFLCFDVWMLTSTHLFEKYFK